MFLGLLNKGTKDLFLELSIHTALANRVLATEEEEIILQYCNEMNIPMKEIKKTMDEETLVSKLSNDISIVEKRIVIIEIVALVLADEVYDEEEKDFLIKLVKSMGLDAKDLEEASNLVKRFNNIFEEMNNFINK